MQTVDGVLQEKTQGALWVYLWTVHKVQGNALDRAYIMLTVSQAPPKIYEDDSALNCTQCSRKCTRPCIYRAHSFTSSTQNIWRRLSSKLYTKFKEMHSTMQMSCSQFHKLHPKYMKTTQLWTVHKVQGNALDRADIVLTVSQAPPKIYEDDSAQNCTQSSRKCTRPCSNNTITVISNMSVYEALHGKQRRYDFCTKKVRFSRKNSHL